MATINIDIQINTIIMGCRRWSYFTRVRRIKAGFAARPNARYKHRPDFASDEDYGAYVKRTLKEDGGGIRVMCVCKVPPDTRVCHALSCKACGCCPPPSPRRVCAAPAKRVPALGG